MNQFSKNITGWLSSDEIIRKSEKLLEANPSHVRQINGINVNLSDSLKNFSYLKDILIQSVVSGIFEELPTQAQAVINSHLKELFQDMNNVNKFMMSLDSLHFEITISGLEGKLVGYDIFKSTLSDISNLSRRYKSAVNGISSIEEKVVLIDENFKRSESLLKEIKEIYTDTDKLQKDTKSINTTANKSNQDIENSKKEILAFKANIDSYKKDIEKKSTDADEIVKSFSDQRAQVDELIKDSIKALGLKSSEGVSAALSTQYDVENVSSKKIPWIAGSISFIILAIVGVLFLILDIKVAGIDILAEGANAIITRIVFVGITITGATFCANQYVKQKALADEYGHKLVLAKSIIAFAQEIENLDPKKAAEYMNNVLNEIIRSPVHKVNEEGMSEKSIDLIRKIVDTVTKEK